MLAFAARRRFEFFLGPPTDATILRHFLVFHERVLEGSARKEYLEVKMAERVRAKLLSEFTGESDHPVTALGKRFR
jgi:hypothetical protein